MRRCLNLVLVAAVVASSCGTGSSDATAPDLLATVATAPTAEPEAADTGTDAQTPTATEDVTPDPTATTPPALLQVDVTERRAHDPSAFTQGLEFSDGRLFESRGRYGTSGLSEIDPETGAVLRWAPLDDESFGEGITVLDDRIFMLTWQAETAYVFDRDTFDLLETHQYQGEGWGICSDGDQLVMSNGTSELTFRDPETFRALDTLEVTYRGEPVALLNELECVGDRVYANVWKQDVIVVIDPATGIIETLIDARGLRSVGEDDAADVLNGIAYDERTDSFLLTGKLWPAMFVVDLVE